MYTIKVFNNYIEVTKTTISIQEDITELREYTTEVTVKFLVDICKDWNITKFIEEFEKTVSYKV